MPQYKHFILFTAFFCLWQLNSAYASHNQAGEITYEQIGPRTVKVTVTTYTKISSQINRDSILLNWGDGEERWLSMDEDYPIVIGQFSDTQKSVYTAEHTYAGPGSYTVYFADPFRNSGVRNIPNSDQVFMTLSSTVVISPFLGNNASPILLNPPLERACLNEIFQHNPAAFDPDNDSLYYSLTTPKGENAEDIAGYVFPNNVSVDPNNGTLTWESPEFTGQYNFAIKVEEFRNGFKIGEVIRDMQVNVAVCNNKAPVIEDIAAICVWAGDSIQQKIKAFDENEGDAITLEASGGAFSQVDPALASFETSVGIDSVEGMFYWNTNCAHVQNLPHQVTFKATDNNQQTQLSAFKTFNIEVITPPVTWVDANYSNESIELSWNPSVCENENTVYEIYRKEGESNWMPDSCEKGIPQNLGYEKINEASSNNFTDENVEGGRKYCYRIVSIHNNNKSVSSSEICVNTPINQVLITNVSIANTSENGSVDIAWKKVTQNINGLDTNELRYQVYAINGNNEELVYTSAYFSDTSFTHTNVNTTLDKVFYRVDLVLDGNPIQSSEIASSPFLTGSAFNEALVLNLEEQTPWLNERFVIYWKLEEDLSFEVQDTIKSWDYRINGLQNNKSYCFKIASIGHYSSDAIPDTLVNFSQSICLSPIDTLPPCLPSVNINANCVSNRVVFQLEYQNDSCDQDWQETRLYVQRSTTSEVELIASFNNIQNTYFEYQNNPTVVGCYGIEVLDSVGNSSGVEITKCVQACDTLSFPNIITPNNDGMNDVFEPIEKNQIIDFQLFIYNRWGGLVYEKSDFPIEWNGRDRIFQQNVSSGVYFYVIEYHVPSLEMGRELKRKNGFFELLD